MPHCYPPAISPSTQPVGYKEMSSILAPSYVSLNAERGGSRGVSANEYNSTQEPQINFGDLTPYLTYEHSYLRLSQGLQRNLVQKKFSGIDSEQLPLFRGRKCSFRGIPKFTEETIPKLGTEGNGMKKFVLQKILLQQTELTACFCPRHLRNAIPNSFLFRGIVQNGIQSVCSTTQPLNRSTAQPKGRKKLNLYHRYYYSTHQ